MYFTDRVPTVGFLSGFYDGGLHQYKVVNMRTETDRKSLETLFYIPSNFLFDKGLLPYCLPPHPVVSHRRGITSTCHSGFVCSGQNTCRCCRVHALVPGRGSDRTGETDPSTTRSLRTREVTSGDTISRFISSTPH